MPTTRIASQYRRGAILVALVAAIGGGCSSDRGMGLRATKAGQDSATIARDRRSIPRGQVIPPAGLGVDLVRANGGGESHDAEVGLAAFSRNGVPGQRP